MDLHSIHSKTDKGLPAYTAANINPASEDIFLFGGEELVPLSDGTYRCENEVEFIRFEKAASTEAGPIDAWTGTLPDGSVFRFGISTESRITRTGSNPNSFADTYEWKLASHIDVNGNVIEYQYATFSTESTGVLYPVTIEYAKASESIHHRIVFTYSGSADFPENRTDIFSD